MDIKLEIKRCQGELAGLSRIINEVEGDVGRFSLDNLNHRDDALPKRRSDQQPKNHDQAVTHYNKHMMELDTLKSQTISHPIHRLPLELLEHIFHLLLEIESPWPSEFPLNLTQVCSQWESLVLSVRNRRLWSTVRVDPADPDWLERLHLYLFLSRDEGLNIHITDVTQSIVDALTGHHQRIRSLPGLVISQIRDPTTSEPNIIQVVITNQSGQKHFSFPLSSSVTALPFVYLGEGSLHRLRPFLQLRVLEIDTKAPQLLELGGPLQLPALQVLLLQTREDPLDFLRIFAPSQLLDLDLQLVGSLSPAAYYELETFIIGHMPKLQWVILDIGDYVDSVFLRPVEESTTQSSAVMQSASLRRIDCRTPMPSEDKIPPFERLIESAPHLKECHLDTPMKSLPCFTHHIQKLELNFYYSSVLPVVNGGQFKLEHLEVLVLTFATDEQLELLTLFQAPSLLSLKVSYEYGDHSQWYWIPLDVIWTFISTSQGVRHMVLDLGFPVSDMALSLPELRNLKISNISHIFSLASLDVPRLQYLTVKIDDGGGEDESKAGGEDSAEDAISKASPPPTFQAVGSSDVLDMVNTRQILQIGNEEQRRNIIEEDDNGAKMDWLKDMDSREAPSGPVVTRAPTFPALTFEHLKVFQFEVSTAFDSYLIRALPYFPGILTAFPALERVVLPAVSFNNSPYIDQLVNKLSDSPALCPNLQEIRTSDYPNDWSNLLKFLRDRKRASILSNPALRPIHALYFPITPHGSIVEQLQDAMLGKVSIKPFPALFPWPLIDSTLVRIGSSRGTGTGVNSDEVTRSPRQDGDEWTAAMRVQAQEEDITGNSDKGRQNKEQSGCGENEDEVLSCFCCHKAGLVAGCCRVRTRGILSRMEVSSGDIRCSRWKGMTTFEVICLP